MGLKSKPKTWVDGDKVYSADLNQNFDDIYNEFNGNISADNLADNAVTTAKIAGSQITAAKLSAQESWKEVNSAGNATFEHLWVNYGNGFDTAAYMKDHMGFVHLKGTVTDGTNGESIFTLPSGYRPPATQIFVVNVGGVFGSVYIYADGKVKVIGGVWGLCTLDGISFKAV